MLSAKALLLLASILPFFTYSLDTVIKKFDISYTDIILENIRDDYEIVQLHLGIEGLETKFKKAVQYRRNKKKLGLVLGFGIGFFVAFHLCNN